LIFFTKKVLIDNTVNHQTNNNKMIDKKVEISLLTNNKKGILSSIMMRGSSVGLMYQNHHLEKLDDQQSRMKITFEGRLNCSQEDLIDSIESHSDIKTIEDISFGNSMNINTSTSLNSGSRFTILRAGYVITPEALKIAEDRLTENLGPSALVLVQEAATKTKHIGDLYVLLSKYLKGKAQKDFLGLVSDLPSE